MTTIEELYTKVLSNDTEKAAFAEAATTPEGLSAFLKEHDCEASVEEVAAFLKAKQSQQGELADEELDSVAGGCSDTGDKVIISVFGLGVGCLLDLPS